MSLFIITDIVVSRHHGIDLPFRTNRSWKTSTESAHSLIELDKATCIILCQDIQLKAHLGCVSQHSPGIR